MKPLALLAGAAVILAACAAANTSAQLASGDYTVKSYSRLFGLENTKAENAEVATRTCPDGFILLNEQIARDAEGLYRQWQYGCLTR